MILWNDRLCADLVRDRRDFGSMVQVNASDALYLCGCFTQVHKEMPISGVGPVGNLAESVFFVI